MVTGGSDSTFLVRLFMLKYLVRTGLVCRFLVPLPSWNVFVDDVKQNSDLTTPIYRIQYICSKQWIIQCARAVFTSKEVCTNYHS